MNKYMNKIRNLRILMLGLLLLPLGGCFTLLQAPPAEPIVMLGINPPASPLCTIAMPKQLIVSIPNTSSALSTDRVALIFENRNLMYLADTKWESVTPILLQNFMIRYINESGCFQGVGSETMGLATDFRLRSEVEAFQLMYDNKDSIPTAVFRINLYLMNTRTGIVLNQTTIENKQVALGKDRTDLLNALDYVTNKSLLDISSWTNSEMQGVSKN